MTKSAFEACGLPAATRRRRSARLLDPAEAAGHVAGGVHRRGRAGAGAGGHIHPVQAVIAILCIAVGSGASGAINMWYERDIDAMMRRTRDRPLPAGRMTPGEALGFGVTLAVASVLADGHRAQHRRRAAAGRGDLLLCLRLHDRPEAPHAAEHRDRRRRRRVPADDRLGRGRPAMSAGRRSCCSR